MPILSVPLAEQTDLFVQVSIVVPVYNEGEVLPLLYERVRDVLESAGYSFEVVVVDDGSRDDSLEVLRYLSSKDPRLRYLSLSRNFGHQAAQVAGIEHSRGAAVITMDADLQHPPEVIPRMLELWKSGFDVVNTRKTTDGHDRLRRRTVDALFYRVLKSWSGLEVHGSDFRLMDRRVVEALEQSPERQKCLRGLIAWLGFAHVTIPYRVARRACGSSKYTIRKRCDLALTALCSFSHFPLRLLTLFGIATAVPSLLYMGVVAVFGVYAYFTGDHLLLPPGWAVLAGAISFFGGVQLVALGLVGEYLGGVHAEVKARPTYVLKEISDHPSPRPLERLPHATGIRWVAN